MADYDYLDKGQDDGTILGKTSSRKIGFWGTTPYGFVAKDEGNTVLKVIANLQARLAEVEARLEECGIIAVS